MNKKLLFYINTLEHGGAERVLSNLASQFLNAGNNVVFVTSYAVEKEYELSGGIKRLNLENSSSENSSILYRNYSRTKKLINILKKEKPDIVISFLPESNFRAIIAAKLNRIPVVISVRNDPNHEYRARGHYYAQKVLYPFVNGIVFQTEDAKTWFSNKIQNKSCIIMNQVASSFFEESNVAENYYISVGRLTKQKNFKLLINSFTKFVHSYPDEKLFIYGEGELENQLQEQINLNEMQNNIFLKGVSNNIPHVLSEAKAFIMSSDYEGMPNALVEAMAVGIPVISTNCPCGGPKMLIEDQKNGLLVEVGDEIGLYRALLYVEEHKNERLVMKNNAKKFAERFKPENVFEKWNYYVDEVLNKA